MRQRILWVLTALVTPLAVFAAVRGWFLEATFAALVVGFGALNASGAPARSARVQWLSYGLLLTIVAVGTFRLVKRIAL